MSPPASLPTLAPRIPGQISPEPEVPTSTDHTEAEWEEKRPLIVQLYLHDNKKLVQLMSILESRYGFAATQQMYKKRLRKWNVRKRAYRKTDGDSGASSPSNVAQSPATATKTQPTSPTQDTMTLTPIAAPTQQAGLEMVLNSVFSWSAGKLEATSIAADPMSRYLASPNSPPKQDSRTMYRTFELVFDLFNRGQGMLAGKAAQKGFYSLEFVLTEDHPDLIWHILDSIYDMVDRNHLQLLWLFLNHATLLATQRLPARHPLLQILEQLMRCSYETQEDREYVCHLLRQAWLRNVDLLGEHIESSTPQQIWPYEQLIWDGRTRLRKNSALAMRQQLMGQALDALQATYESAPATNTADKLRIEALALEFTQMDVGDKVNAERLAVDLLQHTSDIDSRVNARFQAYAWKMVARLQEQKQELDAAETNLRRAIAMREAAHGANDDIRVIRDMWVLARLLYKVGKTKEAEAVQLDALGRAKTFLEGVQH
ncbi:clr5 domain-containing protein [Sarocladium implicatum]|nr:clr5 domain-containing protein [Sarocladium implicatum]